MPNHNYSQYSNKNKSKNNKHQSQSTRNVHKQESAIAEVKMDITQEDKPIDTVVIMNETIETVSLPEMVEGVVAHCARLNVREKPTIDSSVVCVLNSMSEIQIDVNKSTTNWLRVLCANGAEGYCMREYIDAHM